MKDPDWYLKRTQWNLLVNQSWLVPRVCVWLCVQGCNCSYPIFPVKQKSFCYKVIMGTYVSDIIPFHFFFWAAFHI